MNLQEKYNEYKQRQEAKKFFNQNNDYHLSISDYIKMFVVGTVIAIFSTIAFDFISLQIGWSFSYFDILTGYFTGFIVLKIARYGSEKVGIISHELRTPLTLIIAPLTDLLHKEDMPQEYRQSLELINRNSQRLLWLVNRLMDFHKLEAGKMQLHVGNYNLGTYIPEIIRLFMPVAEKKNTYTAFHSNML